MLFFNRCHALLNKGVKLWTFVLIVSLQLLLSAPEHLRFSLDVNPHETIRTGEISIEHEGVIQSIGHYLLA